MKEDFRVLNSAPLLKNEPIECWNAKNLVLDDIEKVLRRVVRYDLQNDGLPEDVGEWVSDLMVAMARLQEERLMACYVRRAYDLLYKINKRIQ